MKKQKTVDILTKIAGIEGSLQQFPAQPPGEFLLDQEPGQVSQGETDGKADYETGDRDGRKSGKVKERTV